MKKSLWRRHALMVEDGAFSNKLDGVGPVDNRPSTDKLHHISQKKDM